MSLQHIPFYIPYDLYLTFISNNFNLVLSDDSLFIGYLLCNFAYLFLIILLFKIIKFILLTIKNIILG